ncbi:hypothetical protein [Oceanibaculum indicum]|uniref:hypothetical protein n=1 Tax=Oceanibaculum indicum TaxID=526216 RepID=UPI0011C43A23|nr:hypothetical protein [Oceanibaculum indicum]
MTAFSKALPASVLRAVTALAVLAGLLLGMAHPPAQTQTIALAPQPASLELGGGTFGPSGHVLAEDFRQVQQRADELPAPGGNDSYGLPHANLADTSLPVSLAASAATLPLPATRTPDRHRPTGPPSLLS